MERRSTYRRRSSSRTILLWLAACLLVGALAWAYTPHPSSSSVASSRPAQSGKAGTSAAANSAAEPSPTPDPRPTFPGSGKPARPASLNEAVQQVLDKWTPQLGPTGEVGLVVHNLETGDKFSLNGHKNFETASVYKLFVMLAVYYDIDQGNLTLDTPITLTADAADAEEDGYLIVPVGQSLPVRDLLEAMITRSNNTAALMLMFQVKIPRLRQIAADMGFKESDLSDSFNFQATPEDLDQYLSRLATQKLLGPQLDQSMLDLMTRQEVRDRIPALLPAGTKVANKTGNLGNVINDAGVVFLPNGQHLAIAAMVHNFSNGDAATKLIAEVSAAAYNYYTTIAN